MIKSLSLLNQKLLIYISQITSLTNFDTSFVPVNDLYVSNKVGYAVANFVNYDNKIDSKIFDSTEIKTSKIILCDPEYKISTSAPILKAESGIGKVYIFSHTVKM